MPCQNLIEQVLKEKVLKQDVNWENAAMQLTKKNWRSSAREWGKNEILRESLEKVNALKAN